MNKNGPAEEYYNRQKTASILRCLGRNARRINIQGHIMSTVLNDMHPETFRRFMEECAQLIEDHVTVEVIEHHTFAKPDDVNNLDFPNSGSENK